MNRDARPAIDPFGASRLLYDRWLENLSLTADFYLRSAAFLEWMHYGLRTMTEVRRLQAWCMSRYFPWRAH